MRLPIPVAIVILLIVAGVLASLLPRNTPVSTQNEFTTVDIGGVSVRVEIASTSAAREKGLSGHLPLGPNEGMLFVFDWDDAWSFWMKDMQFPIDIIWIDASGTIITIAKNVAPDSYPTAFTPSRPARYVLEVPAGFATQHGIAEGHEVVLQ